MVLIMSLCAEKGAEQERRGPTATFGQVRRDDELCSPTTHRSDTVKHAWGSECKYIFPVGTIHTDVRPAARIYGHSESTTNNRHQPGKKQGVPDQCQKSTIFCQGLSMIEYTFFHLMRASHALQGDHKRENELLGYIQNVCPRPGATAAFSLPPCRRGPKGCTRVTMQLPTLCVVLAVCALTQAAYFNVDVGEDLSKCGFSPSFSVFPLLSLIAP